MIPNDRGRGLLAFAVVMLVISISAVGLRFWSRALGSSDRGAKYWWDDWTALASLVRRACCSTCGLADLLVPGHCNNQSFYACTYDYTWLWTTGILYSHWLRVRATEDSLRLVLHLPLECDLAQNFRVAVLRSRPWNTDQNFQIRSVAHPLPGSWVVHCRGIFRDLPLRSRGEAVATVCSG